MACDEMRLRLHMQPTRMPALVSDFQGEPVSGGRVDTAVIGMPCVRVSLRMTTLPHATATILIPPQDAERILGPTTDSFLQ